MIFSLINDENRVVELLFPQKGMNVVKEDSELILSVSVRNDNGHSRPRQAVLRVPMPSIIQPRKEVVEFIEGRGIHVDSDWTDQIRRGLGAKKGGHVGGGKGESI